MVGLAVEVIFRCHQYLSAVKDCPNHLRTILISASSIKAVIEKFKILHNSPTRV